MPLLVASLVCLLLAFVLPRRVGHWAGQAERSLCRSLKTPFRAALFVGIVAFGVSAGIGAAFGIAEPHVHDEHSYLLSADTYAHGRLTNPTPPEWQHFETFHVILTPTYISKYPPGQGLLLALGQIIWHPILGAWLGVGLACGAMCWMLEARLPRAWAIYGGLTAVFHPGIQTWGQGYLNGNLALCGGCLTLGAALRLSRSGQIQDGILFGVGSALLALSRMYEGAVFALLISVPLMISLLRQRRLLRALAGTLPVLGLLAAFLLYHNFRVTGSAWKLPYVVHEETYGYTPLFVFQQPRTHIVYHHAVMQRFHAGQSFREYALQQGGEGWQTAAKAKLRRFAAWIFHLPVLWLGLAGLLPILTTKQQRTQRIGQERIREEHGGHGEIQSENLQKQVKCEARHGGTPLAKKFIPWAKTARMSPPEFISWGKLAWLCLLGVFLFLPAVLVSTWFYTHYAAPIMSLVFLVLMIGVRRIAVCRIFGRPVGRNGVRGMLAVSVAAFCLAHPVPYRGLPARHAVIAQLEKTGGKHLVLVRYKPSHNVHEEWVYNAADIEAAPIVWVREMGGAEDEELRKQCANRHIWLLEPDESPVRLRPYPLREVNSSGVFAEMLRRLPF